MAAQLVPFYAYDGLRGDGFAVRMVRLGMLSVPTSLDAGLVWALCWAMEVAFGVAYFSRRAYVAGWAAFWLAYIAVQVTLLTCR